MTGDECERCLGNGTIFGYRRGMFNGVPCPDCCLGAFDQDEGRVAGDG